jgi:hypothetical protein
LDRTGGADAPDSDEMHAIVQYKKAARHRFGASGMAHVLTALLLGTMFMLLLILSFAPVIVAAVYVQVSGRQPAALSNLEASRPIVGECSVADMLYFIGALVAVAVIVAERRHRPPPNQAVL